MCSVNYYSFLFTMYHRSSMNQRRRVQTGTAMKMITSRMLTTITMTARMTSRIKGHFMLFQFKWLIFAAKAPDFASIQSNIVIVPTYLSKAFFGQVTGEQDRLRVFV